MAKQESEESRVIVVYFFIEESPASTARAWHAWFMRSSASLQLALATHALQLEKGIESPKTAEKMMRRRRGLGASVPRMLEVNLFVLPIAEIGRVLAACYCAWFVQPAAMTNALFGPRTFSIELYIMSGALVRLRSVLAKDLPEIRPCALFPSRRHGPDPDPLSPEHTLQQHCKR